MACDYSFIELQDGPGFTSSLLGRFTAAFPNQKISTQLAASCGYVFTLDIDDVQIHEDSRPLLLPLTKNLVTVSSFYCSLYVFNYLFIY